MKHRVLGVFGDFKWNFKQEVGTKQDGLTGNSGQTDRVGGRAQRGAKHSPGSNRTWHCQGARCSTEVFGSPERLGGSIPGTGEAVPALNDP